MEVKTTPIPGLLEIGGLGLTVKHRNPIGGCSRLGPFASQPGSGIGLTAFRGASWVDL